MTSSPTLILLFIGHILGDFYLQTNKMAERAEEKFSFVLLHSLFYALCMCAVLFIGIPVTKDIWLVCIWRFFGSTLTLRHIFTRQPAQLPALPIAIALGALCILRPVGIAIRKYGLGSFNTKEEPPPASAAPDKAKATSDRFIRNSGRIYSHQRGLRFFDLFRARLV